MTDIARRFPENPILRPCDIAPSMPGMKIECLLVESDDGVHFRDPTDAKPIFGSGDLEYYGIEDRRVVEIDGMSGN